MNNKTQDPLARWWWPGQWLHIVYGVWIDQLWYWQNVRPRMRGRKQGWGIWAQGMLGTALVVLVIAALTGVVVKLPGEKWGFLILAVFGCTALSLFLSVFTAVLGAVFGKTIGRNGINITFGKVADSVLIGMFFSIALTVMVFGAGLVVSVDSWDSFVSNWGRVVEIAFLSVAGGVIWGVDDGRNWNIFESLVAAIVAGLAFGEGRTMVVRIVLSATAAFGLYLGRRWSIRQVGEELDRKRLANPEMNVHSSLM